MPVTTDIHLKVHAAYEAYQDISVYPPLSNTARYFQQQGDSTKQGESPCC